jgi:hypothetical protein
MTFQWESMDPRENAQFERSQGNVVVEAGGQFWRQVRPCFYRPLIPCERIAPDQVRMPWPARFGGVQFAVPEGERSNSRMTVLAFEDVPAYTPDSLPRQAKQHLRKAIAAFQVEQIRDAAILKRDGHSVYLAFAARTGYGYKAERQDKAAFECWAGSIMACPKNLVLGAYREGQLHAVAISRRVGDTILYATVFSTDEGLRLQVNSLLLHVIRESAAAAGAARIFITIAAPDGPTGTERFFLTRGCSLVHLPARFKLNPLTRVLLRRFRPEAFARLQGKDAAG